VRRLVAYPSSRLSLRERESATIFGMNKTFRDWEPDQVWLLPPSVQDLVPPGHVAHFVRDAVRSALDLEAILARYGEEAGFMAYHPGMMVALLLYAYSQGMYSSRGIARGCEERLDFAALTALQRPDFRTISNFRRRHSATLQRLFVQVLQLCREAGLVKLGHVTLDATKIKANGSRRRAMSCARMAAAEPKLAAEVMGWLKMANQTDRAEDRAHGTERRGDEMPDWAASKERRLAKIREAKAALEAEAGAVADKPKGRATAQRSIRRTPCSVISTRVGGCGD
jgi:transposase